MAKDITELRAASVTVKPNCRKLHGSQQAMQMALDHLKNKYIECMKYDCNKNADFEFVLILRRESKNG